MIHVITNSRQYALDKLMSSFGMRPPFAGLNFVMTLSDFDSIFTPTPLPTSACDLPRADQVSAQPALVIWQRGRMSEEARLLRSRTRDAFAFSFLRDPTNQEMDLTNERSRPRSGPDSQAEGSAQAEDR